MTFTFLFLSMDQFLLMLINTITPPRGRHAGRPYSWEPALHHGLWRQAPSRPHEREVLQVSVILKKRVKGKFLFVGFNGSVQPDNAGYYAA